MGHRSGHRRRGMDRRVTVGRVLEDQVSEAAEPPADPASRAEVWAWVEATPEIHEIWSRVGSSVAVELEVRQLIAALEDLLAASVVDPQALHGALEEALEPVADEPEALARARRSKADDPLLRDLLAAEADREALEAVLARYPMDRPVPFVEEVPVMRDEGVFWRLPLEDGVLAGEVRTFDEEGRLVRRERFGNGLLNGPSVEFDPASGRVLRRAEMRDGELDGTLEIYDDAGRLEQSAEYRRGVPHGETVIYVDGRVRARIGYQDGERHGRFVHHHETGVPSVEQIYREGKLHGESVWYDDRGRVLRRARYVDDQLEGDVVDYYENGQVREKAPPRPVAFEPWSKTAKPPAKAAAGTSQHRLRTSTDRWFMTGRPSMAVTFRLKRFN